MALQPFLDEPTDNEAYKLVDILPMAYPKGKAPVCEMTGLPAKVKCETEHITLFYNNRETAEESWHGIMCKIAPLLGPLRSPPNVIGSEEDRKKREYTMDLSKKALVDLCGQEADKFLVAGRFELALPGAQQEMKFLRELYGEGAVELVAAYLRMAEANVGLARYQQAEQFLSMANWSILKNPDASNALRSKLHRNFGKVYAARGKLDEALDELAKDIYCSSLASGPEHVDASPGYFHAASVFYAQHRIEHALAFYDKVVDAWYKFLVQCRSDPEVGRDVGEAARREAVDMLRRVLATRAKLLGDAHVATGEAKYALGLLHLFNGTDLNEARELVKDAAQTYSKHLGPDHEKTKDVVDVLQRIPVETPMESAPDTAAAVAPSTAGHSLPSTAGNLGRTPDDFASAFPFPADMKRAATQSPIPLPPTGGRQRSSGFDPMTPSSAGLAAS